MMKFKGYFGEVIYDADAKIFHGEVLGLKDVITFQGTTVDELEVAFKDSVDDYLTWCKERGEKPELSFSGDIRIKISPNLHARLAQDAAAQNISLNSLIADYLQRR